METVSKTSKKNTVTKQEIKLVEGHFTPSDASDIIGSVLDVKINFHKLKRLSKTEGNEKDLCEYDSDRITELIDANIFIIFLENLFYSM